MNWSDLDWEVLDRLREDFLSGRAADGPYWHTITDLECYDFTFGERIGWKWDAVLAELRLRGWAPPAGASVLDWGCGSGIAGRRVVSAFGPENFSGFALHDHSPLALDYAEHRARGAFPNLPVARATAGFLRSDERFGLLVVSHVINELSENARAELRSLCARADAVLWVEPGTHADSRALVAWREDLQGAGFNVVAPCTHREACGLLVAGNERHWCHFFASPPAEIHADSNWVKFGQRAGIDLRSLPYSFLALDRRRIDAPAGFSRILGEPRHYKGYARLFNCDASGVRELTLQKRDEPAMFKSLKKISGPQIHRWTIEGDRVKSAEPFVPSSR